MCRAPDINRPLHPGKAFKKRSPNVGLEPTTLRLRVSCSTDWASRANVKGWILKSFLEISVQVLWEDHNIQIFFFGLLRISEHYSPNELAKPWNNLPKVMICWESSSPILNMGYLIGLNNVFQLLTSFRKLLDWTLPALPILKIVQLLVDLSPTFNIYNIFFLSPFEFLFAKSKFDRKFVRGTAVNIFNSGLRFILSSIGNICPSLALLK